MVKSLSVHLQTKWLWVRILCCHQKFKHRKREEHKKNKKVARRETRPGETNDRSKNHKPTSGNKTAQTAKSRHPADRTAGNK